jgi:hypothetical protein
MRYPFFKLGQRPLCFALTARSSGGVPSAQENNRAGLQPCCFAFSLKACSDKISLCLGSAVLDRNAKLTGLRFPMGSLRLWWLSPILVSFVAQSRMWPRLAGAGPRPLALGFSGDQNPSAAAIIQNLI